MIMNKVEIDLNAISYNLTKIRKFLYPETKIIGDVSHNAYGHGLIETGRVTWTSGADVLMVSDIDEAVELRVANIKCPMIVNGPVDVKHYRKLIDFDLVLTVFDFEQAFYLSREAKKQNLWASIDVKIDTGINSFGIKEHEFLDIFQKVSDLDHIKVFSINSEFADTGDSDYCKEQAQSFQSLLFSLQQMNLPFPLVYMSDLDALAFDQEYQFGAVRTDDALYGYSQNRSLELSPALELKSQVSVFSRAPSKATVGRGRQYKTENPKRIAIVPLGYIDGYPSSVGGKAKVIFGGKKTETVGLIEPNYLLFDATGIKGDLLDDVILIGGSGNDMVKISELAKISERSIKELLCSLSEKIKREYRFK